MNLEESKDKAVSGADSFYRVPPQALAGKGQAQVSAAKEGRSPTPALPAPDLWARTGKGGTLRATAPFRAGLPPPRSRSRRRSWKGVQDPRRNRSAAGKATRISRTPEIRHRSLRSLRLLLRQSERHALMPPQLTVLHKHDSPLCAQHCLDNAIYSIIDHNGGQQRCPHVLAFCSPHPASAAKNRPFEAAGPAPLERSAPGPGRPQPPEADR